MLKFLLFQSCVILKINYLYNIVFKYEGVYNNLQKQFASTITKSVIKKMRHIQGYIEELISAGF